MVHKTVPSVPNAVAITFQDRAIPGRDRMVLIIPNAGRITSDIPVQSRVTGSQDLVQILPIWSE